MQFPKQEYRSGLPFPSPEDLPRPGIQPTSPVLVGEFSTTDSPGKPHYKYTYLKKGYMQHYDLLLYVIHSDL